MQPQFAQIDIQKAKDLIDQGQATIIDIRDKNSYDAGHIAQAVSVSAENIENFLKEADRAQDLICYCYHGHSSQGAAAFFKTKGFERVYSIKGGFTEWQKVYPFEKG